MKPDRWARIEALFNDALEMPERERSAFLQGACKDDLSILREVESLLARAKGDGESFELAARDAAAEAGASSGPGIGEQLAHYRVIEKLGSGGMGEVYAAEDTKLHRRVALKILSPALRSDAERRQRFEREAQIVAGLNHPNVVTIYSVERSDDIDFLTMELVEGKPLTDLIPRDGLPLDRLLGIATAIADAVSAAHARNIVHRDLKPANVMVTSDGRVKVLDFGLAKLKEPDASASNLTTLPPEELTGKGWIVGTVAYMSPEQAEGRDVDHRSDIFSIGVLLFELATGRRPFNGATSLSVLSSILKDEPPSLTDVKPGLPREVGRIVRRCLAKDPVRRYQSTLDLRNELEEIKHEVDSGEVRSAADTAMHRTAPRRARPATFVVGGLILAFTLVAIGYFARRTIESPPRVDSSRFTIQPPPGIGIRVGVAESTLAVAPDGQWVAFVGVSTNDLSRNGLYLRPTNELEARFVGPGNTPFFSPDGTWLGFFQNGWIRKVRVRGGEPERIAEVPVLRGASWTADNKIVFAAGAGLLRVSADGGEPEVLTKPANGELHYWPRVLPGGRAALFTLVQGSGDSWRKIALFSFKTGEIIQTSLSGNSPRYLSTGHLVYSRLGTLFTAGFDLERLEVTSQPREILKDVHYYLGSGYTAFDVSDSGSLVYIPQPRLQNRELVWIDRQGQTTLISDQRKAYEMPAISLDGRRIAVPINSNREERDLWLYEIDRRAWRQLTRGLVPDTGERVVWTPDGRSIVVSANPTGHVKLFRVPADGSGTPERLTSGDEWNWEHPGSFSPDGRVLMYTRMPGPGQREIMTLQIEPLGVPKPFLNTLVTGADPSFSPNGKWVAYHSFETGSLQVHVRPYPALEPRVTVSTDGGSWARWAPDGSELFFNRGNGQEIWVVSVAATRPEFESGTPRLLAKSELPWVWVFPFEVSRDGQRFLVVRRPAPERIERLLAYVPNWIQEVTEILGPRR